MIDTLLPDPMDQRPLASLLGIDAIVALDEGDTRRALLRVDELLAQARAMDHHPKVLGHLVAGAISDTGVFVAVEAAREIPVMAQTRGGLDPAVRAQMVELIGRLLDEREHRDGLLRSIRAERVEALDAITAVAEGRASFLGIAIGRPIDGDLRVQRGLRGWVLRNASASLDYMNELMAAASETTDEAAFVARRAATRSALDGAPRWYWVANVMLPSLDRSTRMHYRIAARRRMAAAALAIALYRVDHDDELPAALADLVPAYLPAVPGDPAAGGDKEISYVADGDDPRLYTFGDNGVDDGGGRPDPDAPPAERHRASDDVTGLGRQP